MHDVTTRFMGQVTGAPDLEALILEQLYCHTRARTVNSYLPGRLFNQSAAAGVRHYRTT